MRHTPGTQPFVPAMSRILLVDDNDRLRAGLREALTLEGYDVESVADSLTALAAYVRHRPHAVLTDILMPGFDGLELIRSIRQHDPKASIIAMSGGGAADGADLYLTSAVEFGASLVLQKPFSIDTMLRAVGDLVSRAEAPGH